MRVSARSYLIAGVSLAGAGLIVSGSNAPVPDLSRDTAVAPMAAATTVPRVDAAPVVAAPSGATLLRPAPEPAVQPQLALPDVDGLDPEAARPGIQLSLLTGAPTLGYGNEGLFNAGVNNDGDFNIGGDNDGDFNIGTGNVGDFNIGYDNTGDFNIGGDNTGDFNVGFDNRGAERNFGAGNRGSYNVGFFNTGAYNFGVGNTGVGNVGFFNTGDHTVGAFNVGIRYAGKPGISTGRVRDTADVATTEDTLKTSAGQSEDDDEDTVTRAVKKPAGGTASNAAASNDNDTKASDAADNGDD